MCGILGSVNILFGNVELNLIHHRGPDDFGLEAYVVNDQRIQFGHRRLSIVDLSAAGHQPMKSISKDYSIIFNGEIYNHGELRNSLPGTVSYKGHSDTETILNYFEELGIENSLPHLNGIFAFAFLDLKHELLHLARDRYGVKPLYYFYRNNQLIFSSEIRPLKAILNPEIDNNSLGNSLRMRYCPSPYTIYQDILKVEPGQLITFELRDIIKVQKKYFVEPPKSLGSKKGEYRKLIQEYGVLFENAVERQMMADVEVGILLSGGVDSALVASIAKHRTKKPIKAFTIGFEGDHNDVDEIEFAKETADVLGLEHFTKKINFADLIESIKRIVRIVEEPIATTSIIPMYFLSELAASKVKVVLSGQGADEPLGGYNKYKGLPMLELSRLFFPLPSLLKPFHTFYNKNENLRRLLTAMQCQDNIDSYMEFNSISSVEEVIKFIDPKKRDTFLRGMINYKNQFKEIWKGRTPANAGIENLFLYYDLRTALADDLLMYTDKLTMNFGLECRVPILDNDLIDFIESLDSKYKFNSRNGKIIHKEFAKEYLPSSIIDRKKLGFESPTEVWFRENINDINKIFSSNIKFSNLFNIKEIQNILNQHLAGKNLEKQIFLLLSISFLMDSAN